METKEIIGYSAATIAIFSYLPQVYKSIQKNNFLELSFLFLFFTLIASLLFIVYSYMNNDYPFILVNSVIALCLFTLLVGYVNSYVKKIRLE
jgi:uncharacterized protein with PQ loop repeat